MRSIRFGNKSLLAAYRNRIVPLADRGVTMFDGLWKFIKRHRRKIVVTGAVVGGIVILSRIARAKLKEFQDQEAAQYQAHVRKEHHFENNQRTCNTTVLSMIPPLKEAIIQILRTEDLTATLKTKPENKLDVWAELKVKSFTRMMVCVYASSILVAVLRIRLNIIGGYMFVDHMTNRNGLTSEQCLITEDVQKDYLQQIHYVMDKGLQDLVSATLKATEKAVGGIDLRDQVSAVDVNELIERIRHDMEGQHEDAGYSGGEQGHNASELCRFMMPHSRPQVEGAACREELLLEKLNHETQDIIENSDFTAVLAACLDHSFALLLDHVTECFDLLPRPDASSQDRCVDPTMPMAKLIPIVDGTVHAILCGMPNPFIKDQLLHERGKDFAANVYEAFSHGELAGAR